MATNRFKATMTRAGILAAAAIAAVSVSPEQAMGGGAGGEGGQNGNFDLSAIEAFHITGILRDFAAGHADFGVAPASGMGLYVDMVEPTLDADGKPVYTGSGDLVDGASLSGGLVAFGATLLKTTENVNPAVQSGTTFRQWFREVPNVNASALFPITARRDGGSGRYVFDDRLDTHFSGIKFSNKNRHYTWEAAMQFRYEEDAVDKTWVFGGNDDLWVFIDGTLVADVGGMHSLTSVEFDMGSMGLTDGQMYDIQIFYAERDGGTSRLRIESPVVLFPGELPGVVSMFD